jgi:hypothetical protein
MLAGKLLAVGTIAVLNVRFTSASAAQFNYQPYKRNQSWNVLCVVENSSSDYLIKVKLASK